MEKSAVPRMIPDLSGISVDAEHTDDLVVVLEIDRVIAVEASDPFNM